MSLQGWMVEGLYSDSVSRRSVCFLLKVTVEGVIFAFGGLIFAFIVYLVQQFSPINVPQLPETLAALWLFFSGVIGNRGYCFLTAEKEG